MIPYGYTVPLGYTEGRKRSQQDLDLPKLFNCSIGSYYKLEANYALKKWKKSPSFLILQKTSIFLVIRKENGKLIRMSANCLNSDSNMIKRDPIMEELKATIDKGLKTIKTPTKLSD